MMGFVVIALLAFVLAALVLPRAAPVGALLLSIGVINVAIYAFGDATQTGVIHAGMADGIPRITSWLMAVVLFLLIYGVRGRLSSAPVLFVPLILYLVLGPFLIWPDTPTTWSGSLTWVGAILMWWAGQIVSRESSRDPKYELLFVTAVSAIIAIQGAVCLLQVISSPIAGLLPGAASVDDGRAVGTFIHAGNLGKVVIIFVVLLLPMCLSGEARTRAVATVGVALAAGPLLLSQGRANLFAYAALVLGYAFLSVGFGRIRVRVSLFAVGLLVAFGVTAWFGISIFLIRNSVDPQGGRRARFLEVFHDHVSEVIRWGTGPNNYVEYFGQFDQLTASGWPVHNFFYLQVAEVGVAGVVLLALPLTVYLVLPSVRCFAARSRQGDFARVLLPAVIGFWPLLTTGWGMASEWVLPAAAFVGGVVSASVRRKSLLTGREMSNKDNKGSVEMGLSGSGDLALTGDFDRHQAKHGV